MSNNDLPCSKCKGQHHPACCPLDLGNNQMGEKWEEEQEAKAENIVLDKAEEERVEEKVNHSICRAKI